MGCTVFGGAGRTPVLLAVSRKRWRFFIFWGAKRGCNMVPGKDNTQERGSLVHMITRPYVVMIIC
jgi:hypothetical protein